MRGNRQLRKLFCRYRGPIPAYAGEPAAAAAFGFAIRAYPRVCGGTSLELYKAQGIKGLSPRMRGNRMSAAQAAAPYGPIPAYAGEPQSGWPWAYPRVCGGTFQTSPKTAWVQGLSPRMRGNPRVPAPALCNPGPIPAYAGEPSASHRYPCRTRAYPRVCGGTDSHYISKHQTEGLSPRMRGNQLWLDSASAVDGPIPAYAGEPFHAALPRSPVRAYPRVCGGTAAKNQAIHAA